jgi:hypothetical protein
MTIDGILFAVVGFIISWIMLGAAATAFRRRSAGLNEQEGLFRLDRRLVVNEKTQDLAVGIGMNLNELLHHLDQTDDVAFSDPIAVLLVRRLFRSRPPIEDSGQRT